jgi:heme oxygenase
MIEPSSIPVMRMPALQPPLPLTARLRTATRALHTEVERAGIMRLLLRGELDRLGYCRLLRNLHTVYAALETGIADHADEAGLAHLPATSLFRRDALEDDLDALYGENWAAELVLAPAAVSYAGHLRNVAAGQPLLLAAHAYVRYLGDLSGGQMLARIVASSLGLQPGAGVRFYDFGPAAEVARLASALRTALDQLPGDDVSTQVLVDEACAAFVRHRELFGELAATPTV